MVMPILVLWIWSEDAIWPGWNYNTSFIYHLFVHIYSCNLQVLHDLDITSYTSNNCNIFEGFVIFLFSEGSCYPSLWYQLHNHNTLMNNSVMIQLSILTEMLLIISYISIFDGHENVICVFCKWMYFIPFLFYTVCMVQPICLRWEFMFTDCKHETSLQSIIRQLVFCSCKPV